MFGWPTNAQLSGSAPDRESIHPSIVLTSHLLLHQAGDRAHGSEVTLLTQRIVGMLMETLMTALPAGTAAD